MHNFRLTFSYFLHFFSAYMAILFYHFAIVFKIYHYICMKNMKEKCV